jgi:hypothetical protein
MSAVDAFKIEVETEDGAPVRRHSSLNRGKRSTFNVQLSTSNEEYIHSTLKVERLSFLVGAY